MSYISISCTSIDISCYCFLRAFLILIETMADAILIKVKLVVVHLDSWIFLFLTHLINKL